MDGMNPAGDMPAVDPAAEPAMEMPAGDAMPVEETQTEGAEPEVA